MVSIADYFSNSFQKYSEKTAISFLRGNKTETSMSFTELELNSNQMANMFLNSGIKKSDNVVLLLDKSLVFVVIYIALQKLGAVCVPLNPGFKEAELEYLLNDAAPVLVIAEPDKVKIIKHINSDLNCMAIDTKIPFQKMIFFKSLYADYHKPEPDLIPESIKKSKILTQNEKSDLRNENFRIKEVRPISESSHSLSINKPVEILSHDPGLIIYTSGTTGDPKGAVLTQKNIIHDAENIINIWEISDSDTLCHALPLFHVHGLCFALHTALISGAHIVLMDKFIPENIIDILKQDKTDMACSIFMGVPTMYLKLIDYIADHQEDGSSFNFDHMRLWTSGSAPLMSKDFHKIKNIFGKEPVEREGMSETGMNFSNPLHGKKKPGSIGTALPGLKIRIVDPDTALDVKPGQIGELWLKSDSITMGYWKKPEETDKAFENGWFKTGDLGKKDKDGYYYITDRLKNIIITGGENVSPNEIEKIINMLDEVADSSVTGIADEKWGEKIAAAVVKTKGSGDISQAITDICRKHLHDWKCPKKIVFVDKLPRNTMGKILKQEVKKLFQTKL